MTKAQEMLELHKAGLEQLLAALHAGDPNRELYVRVGDLMRETDALLRLAAQAAEEFGVSPACIHRIRARASFAHVPEVLHFPTPQEPDRAK